MAVRKRLFASFAGVMLADILANSVALLIILIIITVAIKHESEQERLEQVEDVGVLLSREIARSVVVNALPTSAPAVLHDYVNSPLDRNPRHATMPIIELHTGYLRNYYSGDTFTRKELLFQNNRFDRYLRTLHPLQLARMRVDIYSIDLFYIVMSILKAHNHSPRHWHFLAYQPGDKRAKGAPPGHHKGRGDAADAEKPGEGGTGAADPAAGGESQQKGDGTDALSGDDSQHGLPTEHEAGASGEPSDQPGAPWGMPAHISYDAPVENAAYPRDELAYNEMERTGGEDEERPEDLNMPGEAGGQQGEEVEQSDEMFDALRRMMGESMERQQSQRASKERSPHITRFRTANAKSAQEQDSGERRLALASESIGFRAILPALFDFMKEAQLVADQSGQSKLANANMIRELVPRIGQVVETPEDKKFFDSIAAALSKLPEEENPQLPLEEEIDDAQQRSVLSVPVNRRFSEAVLVRNAMQTPVEGVPGRLPVSSRLSLYPAIYQGIRSPFRDNMMVLTPDFGPDAPRGFRWRVITTVSPKTDDFVVSFVYAALGDDGRLLIAADENAVELNEVAVETVYPTVPFRGELWTMALYALAALLVAFGVLRTYRRFA